MLKLDLKITQDLLTTFPFPVFMVCSVCTTKKMRNQTLKGHFFPILKNEKMTSQFFDILSGHPREAKRAQKGLVSSVSTRVMGIYLICLLLPTLLNKIIAFLNFLV